MIQTIHKILEKPFLALLATVVLAILCFIPSENLPSANDKTAHLVAFMGISFLWLIASAKVLKTIMLCTLFGVFIEIVQYLLPESFHRGFEVLDMVADAVGVLLGFVVYKIFLKLFPKNNPKP